MPSDLFKVRDDLDQLTTTELFDIAHRAGIPTNTGFTLTALIQAIRRAAV